MTVSPTTAEPTAAPSTLDERPSSSSTTPTPRRKPRPWKEYGLFALLAFPNLILIAVFAYGPVLGNFYLSLTDWDMVAPEPTFVGLKKFQSLLASSEFAQVMGRTLIWVLSLVGGSLILGLGLAVLLSTGVKGTKVATASAFAPHVVSGVAVAAVWLFLMDPNYGLSRLLFTSFGFNSPAWMTDSKYALLALIIVSIWKGVGFVAIVYLAAIQGIPSEVREAAAIDGAGRWATFWNVIFPLLSPTTFFLTITQIIGAFQSFDIIAMMTGGGPGKATTTLSWYIYREGFRTFDVGRAAAASVVMFVLLLFVTGAQLRYTQKKVHY